MTWDIRPWIASMEVLELKYHKRKVSIQRLLNIRPLNKMFCVPYLVVYCFNTSCRGGCMRNSNEHLEMVEVDGWSPKFFWLPLQSVYCNITLHLVDHLFTSHSCPQFTHISHLEMVSMFRFLLHLYYFIRYYHVPVSGSFC